MDTPALALIARVAADLLERAADQFDTHGCNDYELPCDARHMSFIHDAQMHVYGERWPVPVSGDDATVVTSDALMMRYCAYFLRELMKAPANG